MRNPTDAGKRFRRLHILQIGLVVIFLSACSSKQISLPDPDAGRSFHLPASVFVLRRACGPGDYGSAPCRHDLSGVAMSGVTGCYGCDWTKNRLAFIAAKDLQVTELGQFDDIPPWYAVDSDTLRWKIVRPANGPDFIVAAIDMQPGVLGDPGLAAFYEQRIAEASIHPTGKRFYRIASRHFKGPDWREPVLGMLKSYGVVPVAGSLRSDGFEVAVDLRGLGVLILGSLDWDITISPVTNLGTPGK